ncbi:phage holin family protein [Kribbella speibonae]|uniref:Phage holin family protein n=1 Tax=Kribbella speibonae TaxID=1572660 RepID=A0A4R0IGQ4_9ACTN|nr:phage holin family protein [Kribbella speibonae]TCC19588.1 phage holin family protein [Kribbella speibonae]TCC31757.1 phage holin family protein [Kribbella speibonae]
MSMNGDEPTVGQLVANASKDLSSLVRSEIELAKTELKKTAIAAGTGAGMFAAAGFLALLAVILLCISAAYGLTAAGLHPAIAFLIVAGAFLLIGAILVFIGMRALKSAKGPTRAIETSKESVEALKAIGKGDDETYALPEPGVRR